MILNGCHLKSAVFSRTIQAPWRLLLQPLVKATQFVQVLGLASTIRATEVAYSGLDLFDAILYVFRFETNFLNLFFGANFRPFALDFAGGGASRNYTFT